MFSFFKRVNPEANALYLQVQKGVRTPALYITCGVEDTVEGRTEMLYLHASLLLHRFKSEDKALSQAFIEVLFSNMDAELRELGIGDTKVAKKIKDMGQSFYGRLAAYESDDLLNGFTRNIPVKNAKNLAEFAIKSRTYLASLTKNEIINHQNLFGISHE